MKDLISVTIMVRDSNFILDEFLKRLSKQKTKLLYELIVLYYGKGKDTLRRLKPFSSKIIKISPGKFDLGVSRDFVCKNTSGEYVVTVSVDALPTTNSWLQELVEPMMSNKADIVQGEHRCPKHGDQNYPNFFYWERNYLFFYTSEGKRFFKQYGNIGLSCVNMAFRKKVWENGGFSGVSYCEDKIFQKRAYNSGYVSIFNKKAATLHAHSYTTIKSLFKRVSNEGLGWKQVGERYSIFLLLKDLLRFDLHTLVLKALIKNKLKYSSEVLFFVIRPVALYWGNHFVKSVY
ncbi:MAG: glycosyltransferase [Candidatus Shapirobacteria bacterium]|nr:glycosyltransferase [Candidatus Shapirobacteria bacterium]